MTSSNRSRLLPLVTLAASLMLVGGGCMPSKDDGNPSPQPSAAVNAPAGAPGAGNMNTGTPGTNGGTMMPDGSTTNPAMNAPRTATVKLNGVKGGDVQYGSATLTDLAGNHTRIDIVLNGDRSKSTQPAAIYAGTCATQQAEEQYNLNPVVNGKSSTTLDVNISAILDKAPQALKVREDGTTPNLPFAACAELK